MPIDLILTGFSQSLILALVTFAVMIPFRLLNLADLTAEGAYPLGGAICAQLIVIGVNPIVAMAIATLIAGLMGIATGLIYLKLKVNTLLAGIILTTMAYSVDLRIMGKPNISLFDIPNIFNQNGLLNNVLILLVIISLLISIFGSFLKTEFGLRLRAVGLNTDFAKKQGISVVNYTLLGLFLAGCFSGLAGSFIVQLQNYMDISMGIGIVIHALAALMIGEKIIGNNTLLKQLLAPLIGAIVYQQIQGIVLFIGLAPSDLKFFIGGIVLIVIAIQKPSQKIAI